MAVHRLRPSRGATELRRRMPGSQGRVGERLGSRRGARCTAGRKRTNCRARSGRFEAGAHDAARGGVEGLIPGTAETGTQCPRPRDNDVSRVASVACVAGDRGLHRRTGGGGGPSAKDPHPPPAGERSSKPRVHLAVRLPRSHMTMSDGSDKSIDGVATVLIIGASRGGGLETGKAALEAGNSGSVL